MYPATLALLATLLPTAALAQEAPGAEVEPPPGNRNYVAVVVGISSYDKLPDQVELDFARSDSATVARALREKANFNHVFQLNDGEATKAAVQDILQNQAAQLLGPNDVFLLYFVGHGVGADLDLPILLAHDSTLENGQEDGLELQALARDLQTWTRAGVTLIVTDAIHRNQLDGIYFYGPSATQWPTMPQGTMIVSSSQTSRPAGDGVFAPVFASGIAGSADANRDSYITSSELFTFLLNRLSPEGQIPVAAGTYPPDMIVAQGVTNENKDVEVIPEDQVEVKPPEPVYPEYNIDKAKFVWIEGGAQSVQCLDAEVTPCEPSCYVWDFTSGPCKLTAVIDGKSLTGEVVILGRGKYECGRRLDHLECSGP